MLSYSQTYNSAFEIKEKKNFITEVKNRTITVSDKEISITNFIGGIETQYFVVNKIEYKDWPFDGNRKTYYCTTKDEDVINGYQKAIIYFTYDTMVVGLFADEITIYKYTFNIK
jgi:hypothetical protein